MGDSRGDGALGKAWGVREGADGERYGESKEGWKELITGEGCM